MKSRFIILLLIICLSYQYNTYEASTLKSTSYEPDKDYDASQPITDFNVEMIKYYSWFASYGYCTDSQIKNGECCGAYQVMKEWDIVDHAEINESGTFNFNWVILNSDKFQKIIIAVPGTREGTQLIYEAVYSGLVKYNDDEPFKMSNYFLSLFTKSKNGLFNERNLNFIKNKGYQVIVTGHSLGGAIASIISFAVKYEKLFDNDLTLITYGQPRTGNYYFADYVTRNVDRIFRIVRKYDVVPNIPPWIVFADNYWHIGGMYVLNAEMNEFTQCGYYEYEADTLTGECQYEISISDLLSYHTYYFNPDTKLSCRCAGE
jgi:hypothetical protein